MRSSCRSLFPARGRGFFAAACLSLGLGRAAAAVYYGDNRPPLRALGSGGDGLASLDGYLPRGGTDFPRGRIVPDNGGRDFFGRPVPQDRPPSIGAAE